MAKQSQRFWTSDRDSALRDVLSRSADDTTAAVALTGLFGKEVSRSSVTARRIRLGIERPTAGPPYVHGQFSSSPPRPEIRPHPARWAAEPDPFPSVRFTEPKVTPVAAKVEEKRQEALKPDADIYAEAVAKLVNITRRKAMSLEEVCDELDVSPAKARMLVGQAQQRGFRVEVDGAYVGRRPGEDMSPDRHDVRVASAGEKRTFAAVGDIHFGSKYHMGQQFKDFCELAYSRGVRTFLHVGDLLDGVYKHSVWDQSARGFDEQVNVATRELPRWNDAAWYFCLGNHDETFCESSGMDVGRTIVEAFRAAGRTDLHYLGARGAYVNLKAHGDARGLFVELWHPRGGSAYARSYKLQKRVEGYAPGAKPDVLLCGHFHQSLFTPVRGVHAISCGAWQGGQSAFGKSLVGSPDIGSWIVTYSLTEGGTVRSFAPEWIGYQEREIVRPIEMG